MKKIIYTGAFRFPEGDAASHRVLGIAKALRYNNIETLFCGWENSPRIIDLTAEGIYKYQNFEYYSQDELDFSNKSKVVKLIKYLFRGIKTIKWIEKFIKTNKIDAIIVYNANSYFIYSLHKLCKKNQIKLVCDCTEWYEGKHLPGGSLGIFNADNNFRIRVLYPKVKNIISISSYLHNYFIKKKCNSIVVPPLVDLTDEKWKSCKANHNPHNKIFTLIYAGDPGKKDIISSLIDALNLINANNLKIKLLLVGITNEELKKKYLKSIISIPNFIKCLGKIDHRSTLMEYKHADFSIILRENKRYANSGFPTKLVESLSSGIPVIANSTSDISKYVIEGETGFIVNSTSPICLKKCFEEILELNIESLATMKKNAYKCAEKCFHYQNYSNLITDFIIK